VIRRTVAGLAVALGVVLPASGAAAHPLGNFSVNHLDVVAVSRDRVDVQYTLDQAEIPTFQERGLGRAAILARKRGEVARAVTLMVDGRPVPLTLAPGGRLSFPPGQGGLSTTRVELRLSAPVDSPRVVILHDGTFPGRVGWKAVVAAPGRGTDTRSSVPAQDPTHGLRTYPKALLTSPADVRTARLAVRHGTGALSAPAAPGAGAPTTHNRSGDGLAGVFSNAAAGHGVLLLLLLAAFWWGALHALSPGHGKAMVAAYLVGTRGSARHAVALGLTVTITHTAGVFALGLVTLGLSQYVLPEDLYPWLNLASGLLVLCVGAGVLRSRARRARAAQGHGHDHGHCHGHDHDHDHDHNHGHHHPEAITRRGILAMGASAGLIPCPSALVVLLGAIAQHQVGLGLVLIVAFSAGLAATLTGLGILVVHAGRLAARLSAGGRLVTVLPAVSALAIVAVGVVLTAQAVPKVVG
jgi:nickel/cobalt exporter